MEEFKSNSHKTREETPTERKKVEKVIRGNVKTKKKSSIKSVAEVFMPEDVDSVKSHIIFEVIVPALKDTFYDAVTSGLSMLLGGNGRGSNYSGGSSSRSRESYSSYYNKSSNRGGRTTDNARGSRYKYDDIIFDTRGEAEEVLDVLCGLIEEYGMVNLTDLYDSVGMPANYTDEKYGWCDLRTATVNGSRTNGYIIKFPRIMLLD